MPFLITQSFDITSLMTTAYRNPYTADLVLDNIPKTDDITLTFHINGDYNNSDEYLDVGLEGTSLGRLFNNVTSDDIFDLTGDVGKQYVPMTLSATLAQADLAGWLADGKLSFAFDDSYEVDFFGSNKFVIDISYEAPLLAVKDAFTTDTTDPALTGNVLVDNGFGADQAEVGATLVVTEVNGDAAGIGTAITTTLGGSLTLNADGTFTYTPPVFTTPTPLFAAGTEQFT